MGDAALVLMLGTDLDVREGGVVADRHQRAHHLQVLCYRQEHGSVQPSNTSIQAMV
jgi:hypothetical protein